MDAPHAQGGEIESSAPVLRRVWPGHVLAVAIGLATIAVFSLSIYQFEFWQHYFFREAVNVGDACSVAVQRSAATPPIEALRRFERTPVTIPHPRGLLASLVPADAKGARQTAYYRCDVRVQDFGREEGVVNLHTGWIVGEIVEIFVNGQQRASFHQLAKPAVVLTLADLAQPTVAVEVIVQGPPVPAGFIGLTPLVAARGATTNAKILAVDFALTNQKKLYTILPLLTLGLVLIFGWWIGFRTRTMTVTMFYLCLSAARNVVPMLADFWPWNLQQTNWLTEIALHAATTAFVLFAMETMGLWSKIVPRLMITIASLALMTVGLTLVAKPSPETVQSWRFYATCVESLLMAATMVYGWRAVIKLPRASKTAAAVKRTGHITVYLTGFVLFATWLDYALINWTTSQLRLSPQVEKILPLFVGGILFYTLHLIEQRLREERERRAKMETELAIAAKLQGILVPKDLDGKAHGFGYEIMSQPHGILGGDWVRVYNGQRGALFVLGDVVGKGPSAALTHSGIASSWESQIKLWERGAVTAAELMAAINGTMFDLYQGTMNTTFAFAEVSNDGKVRLAAGGNYWLHLNATKPSAVTSGGRSLLGLKSEFSVEFKEISLQPGEWLVCFTDGVLEGNRPVSRFMRSVQSEFASLTGAKIRSMLAEAGKDQVHPDDASILILRREPLASESAA